MHHASRNQVQVVDLNGTFYSMGDITALIARRDGILGGKAMAMVKGSTDWETCPNCGEKLNKKGNPIVCLKCDCEIVRHS
jgi:hypothetical protein